MIKFFYYQLPNQWGKMYIYNNIVSYRVMDKKFPNSSFKNIIRDKNIETIELYAKYNIKYCRGYRRDIRQYLSIDYNNFYNDNIIQRKEIKNYLQQKKFMLSFENKLKEE